MSVISYDSLPSLPSSHSFLTLSSPPLPSSSGARSADAIIQGGLNAAQEAVKARMGGKKSGGGGGGGGGKSGGGSTDDVVTLTDSNFEEKVINSDEPWLVEFFAPW